MAKKRTKKRGQTVRDWEATFITLAAMLVGTTRWVTANMAGEGFSDIPASWLIWWIPASGFLSACMAVVEAWAFGYVGTTLSHEKERRARGITLVLALLTVGSFLVVLTPSIAGRVAGIELFVALGENLIATNVWAAALAFSTIGTMLTVGYCSGRRKEQAENIAQGNV